MTTATARADLSVIKARQQKTWASGDYAVIASRIGLASELLADAADLQAGWQVLDVACGNGNATLAAARSGTHALGVDYVPGLLEDGRGRAVAEGLRTAATTRVAATSRHRQARKAALASVRAGVLVCSAAAGAAATDSTAADPATGRPAGISAVTAASSA